MMLWVLSKATVFLLLSLHSFARPQRPSTTNLPAPLRQIVPDCAQRCVSTVFVSNFPTLACLKPDKLESFCCQYSSVAFALEQLILSCIENDCPSSLNGESVSIQNICERGSSTTESPESSTTTVRTSTFSSDVTFKTSQSILTNSKSTNIVSSTKATDSTSLTQPTSTSEIIATDENTERIIPIETQTAPLVSSIAEVENEEEEAEDGDDDNDPGPLTTGQIIGISMSAVGALALALGAMSIIAYFRRRRLQRSISEDETFGFQSSSRPSLEFHASSDKPKITEAIPKPKPVADLAQPVILSRSADRSNLSPASMQLDSIGIAISSEIRTDKTLPERPMQKPRKPAPISRISSTSETTIFEEDGKLASDKKPKKIITNRNSESANSNHIVGTPPFLYEDQLSDRQEKPPVPPKPSLSVKIPKARQGPDPRSVQPYAQNQAKCDDAGNPRLVTASRLVAMLAARQPVTDKVSSQNESSNRSSFEDIPQYYTTPRNQFGGLDDSWEYNPSAGRRLDSGSRASSFAKRDSRASETSFETTIPDEETPPLNESKKLSPVVESPISGLRYPKVPRSSNQLVARQSASLRDSSDDEASKSPNRTPLSARSHRRNQSNQSSIKSPSKQASENQLISSGSKNPISQFSVEGWQTLGSKDETAMVAPLKLSRRYEKVSEPNFETKPVAKGADTFREDTGLKSPLWDPQLYPLRRGDELFLYVK